MRTGGTLTYLHTDHLGSVTLTTGGSTVEQQYYAYGRKRGGGTLPTERNYTGQRKDTSGLLYYNARYYDPQLGTFISPDTIVPDPFVLSDYNRYAYVRGNPLKYNDPTGHIAVCFKGGAGNQGTEAPVEGFLEQCQSTLSQGGYNETHGEILTMFNGVAAIEDAYARIVQAKAANPDEPVLIVGYSWGGAAALDLAGKLNHTISTPWGDVNTGMEPVPVDLLFLIDPEDDMRGAAYIFLGEDARPVPTYVPGNVRFAVNVFAGDASQQSVLQKGVDVFGKQISFRLPAYEWTHANGLNHVNGALNIELSQANTGVQIDHYSIRAAPQTYQIMEQHVRGSLQ